MKKRTKTILLCLSILVVTAVSGLSIWYLLIGRAPIGNGNVLDVAWYHENGTEFTITTADELYEFAELSEHYDFENQTVKLGADIVVNEGNAEDWIKTLPKRRWEPIDGFAGTFDGQGHTISGLCGLGYFYSVDGNQLVCHPTGMFSNTDKNCVIKDFRLVNSYFCNDLSVNEGVGSISSNGGGTFEGIYSNALIVSYKFNNGGIVGMLDKKATITNCWFDGEIRVEGRVGRYSGGIVGRVLANNAQNKIEHCLNTADISSTVTGRGLNIGGIVGNVQNQARVSIEDCLTVGDVTVDYTSAVGSFLGYVSPASSVIIKDSYAKAEGFSTMIPNVDGDMVGSPMGFNEIQLIGKEACRWTTLDFKNYWAIVEEGTPVLQHFAEEIPSVKGIKKGYDISWYSEAKSEYVITTAQELYGFALLSHKTNFAGKTIKLGGDIVLNEGNASDWIEQAPANRWNPIGAYGYAFDGKFDGQGHTISGIYMNTCSNSGLFAETGTSAVISNFKLENSYLETFGGSIGSIVGRAAGSIKNVYSNATVVSAQGYVGGLVGQSTKSKSLEMNNCWYDGYVKNTGNTRDDKMIGGIVGDVRSKTTIKNCLNTGTVDASVYTYNQSTTDVLIAPIAGGIVGYVERDNLLALENSLNVGKVVVNEAANAGYGAVIGYVEGDVTAYGVYTTKDCSDTFFLNKTKAGQVCCLDIEDITGYKAYQWTLLDFENSWAVNKSGTPVLKTFASEVPNLSGIKKEYDVSWYGLNKNTYVLDSREDLFGFWLMSYNTDFAEKTVKLGKDITVNKGVAADWGKQAPKYAWTPIGSNKYPFKGNFDGAMHSISGIYQKTSEEYSGFFSVLPEGSSVRNLKMVNSYFETSESMIGSIVGSASGTFSNLYSNAIVVSSSSNAGGFIGRIIADTKITDCWFDGSVTITGKEMPNRRAAGIAAMVYAGEITVSHCLNTGTIAAPNYVGPNSETNDIVVPLVGGLIGHVGKSAKMKIEDSLNTGKIVYNPLAYTGFSSVVGYIDDRITIENTYATNESCEKAIRGKVSGSVTTFDEADITGYRGYQWMDLDFDKHWAVVVNPSEETPILKVFASTVPSLAGIEKAIDVSWYDGDKKEFVLYDRADLNGLAYLSNTIDFEGKTIKLGKDIVVNSNINNPEFKWDSIGSKALPFAGTFDGCMHKISGLYAKSDAPGTGLFARTAEKAVVKNLILTNSYFESSTTDIGSIAGIGHGTFDTIKSDAIVVGCDARVGGLIGHNSAKGTKMTNCWFAGKVTNTGNGSGCRGTGGLVGVAYSGDLTIENCLNTGIVDASAYAYNQKTESDPLVAVFVGGLVGYVHKNARLSVNECLNTGEVKYRTEQPNAADVGFGSAIGYVEGIASLSTVYVTAESCDRQSGGTVSGKASVYNEKDIKGLSGYQWERLDLDFQKYWTLVADTTPILKDFADKVIDIAKVDKLIDTTWYDGKAGSTYKLYDKADLYGFAVLSQKHNFEGMTIKLANDIVVNKGEAKDWATNAPEYVWSPIGNFDNPFQGTFTGLDEKSGEIYEISGVYIKTADRFSGLFGATGASATISNIKLTNSYLESTVTGNADFGGLVGYAQGTFNTIYSDAIVVGAGQTVGGLLGQGHDGVTMTNCWFDGSVTSARNDDIRVGGLLGFASAGTNNKISNCLNSGAVSTPNANTGDASMGGLYGGASSGAALSVEYSLNVGTVNAYGATGNYGSVTGWPSKTTFTSVYATTESCGILGTSDGIQLAKKDIVGLNGYQWEKLNLDFKTYWTFVVDNKETTEKNEEDTPILQSFADKVIDVTNVEKKIDTSWYDGVANSTYTLYDKADLEGFAVLSQKHNFEGMTVKLGNDIVVNKGDAADWATKAAEYSWTPIGSFTNPFQGTFTGLNEKNGEIYEISGVYLKTASRYTGLFGATGASATISNLKLTNSYLESTVTGNADFGGLVGYAQGTFNTIYSDAIVVGAGQTVGGLLGQGHDGFTMTNCWFDGSVTSTRNDDIRVGGLLGFASAGTDNKISNCLNSGVVSTPKANTSDASMGGLFGGTASKAGLSVEYSLNVGTVNAYGATGNYGSITGWASKTVFTSVYATTESCSRTGVTGIDGVTRASILGEEAENVLKSQGFAFDTVWSTVSESTPVLKTFVDVVIDTDWYDGKAGSTYTLYDKADLYGFAVLSKEHNFKGMTVQLANDIVMNSGKATDWATIAPQYSWTSIGSFANPFQGTFTGLDKKSGEIYEISGIYLKTATRYTGLFGATGESATISNLKFTNSYLESTVTGNADFGGLVGYAQGTFNTIYSDAIVVGAGQTVGGLLGQGHDGFTMTKCWFDGSVTSTRNDDIRVGGLLGFAAAGTDNKISNCLNSGEVRTPNANTGDASMGGLFGGTASKASLSVEYSLNVGTVNSYGATGNYGSITGWPSKTTFDGVYATTESCSRTGVTGIDGIESSSISGDEAEKKLKDFDFDKIWIKVDKSTPILKDFVDKK